MEGITHLHWIYYIFNFGGNIPHHISSHPTEALQSLLLHSSTEYSSSHCRLPTRKHNVLLHSAGAGHVGPGLGYANLRAEWEDG